MASLAVFGHDDRDWLALEDDLVLGDRETLGDGVLVGDERRRDRVRAATDRLEVGGGQHRDDAGHRLRRGGVDARDARVRVRAADDGHGQRARADQVLDVAPAAGDQARVLAAMDLRANHLC